MGKEDLLNKGAILQRDEETYAVMAKLLGGVLDIETARKVADAAEKYGAKTLKCTGAQRLAIIGIKEEDIDAVVTVDEVERLAVDVGGRLAVAHQQDLGRPGRRGETGLGVRAVLCHSPEPTDTGCPSSSAPEHPIRLRDAFFGTSRQFCNANITRAGPHPFA